jgi:hypothetical protein
MGYLRGTHYQAKLTDDEFHLVRIWIDGGGLYCSHNACNDTGYPPRALLPPLFAKLDETCIPCHQQSKEFQARHGQDGPHGNRRERFPGWRGYLVDFSAPRKSLALRAPLAKEAGGLGWCRDADGKPVFANKDDCRLSTLAALLPKADATGRVPINSFELPGFQPIGAYFRVMQDFGALRFDFDPARDRLDLEALDQAYYRLFYPGADDSGVPNAAASGKKSAQ